MNTDRILRPQADGSIPLYAFIDALNAKFPDYGTFVADVPGQRYARVLHQHGSSRSAYAFIEIATGNVLKPAGWKGPAKHARGNIFADDRGLGCCGRYSVSYLR